MMKAVFRYVIPLLVAFAVGYGVRMLLVGEVREPAAHEGDYLLIHNLLVQDLQTRRFSFAIVVHATSGKQLLPLDMGNPAHARVVAAINAALREILPAMSQSGAPVRQARRINEASRYFEDALIEIIDATEGLRCESPPTREGGHQRSGYPDLKITDEASGTVFYLDPKLVEQGTAQSTFRTFYFEPKNETLKINDDAVHLLVGIEHDGKNRAWTFTGWRLIDLSKLDCRLKAEFQSSNADLYDGSLLEVP